jgi:thiol-disulfide isomerase/thioredoxin
MNNMRKTTLLVLLSTCLSISAFADIVFIEGDLKVAKARAAREGKLILLDFWASYCTPCRMMEEYTFTNSDVEDYIKAHYIPVKVDIQSFDGFDLKNQFKVSVLPTIIVLTSKGAQVGRHEETFSASRLMPVLSMYNLPKNRLKSNVPMPIVTETPKPAPASKIETSSRPSASTHTPTPPKLNSATNPARIPKKETPPVTPPVVPSVASTSRTLSVDGAIPTTAQANTFTIQIAAYFGEAELKEAMEEVTRKFENKQKIFISRRRDNGKFIYRVLIGKFPSRQAAQEYINDNNLTGIVKNFDVLK